MKETASFKMPSSNVGSGPAVVYLQEYFGPGKWDKPPQVAALLDGLIAMTEGIRQVWQEEKPWLPNFSDPSGQWERVDKELSDALETYRDMRADVGSISGKRLNDPEASAHVLAALLNGDLEFYSDLGQWPKNVRQQETTLPLAGLPYRSSAQMSTIVQHNHEILVKWVEEDLPASVVEGLGTVSDVVGAGASKVVSAAAGTTKTLFDGVWQSIPMPVKFLGFGFLGLYAYNTFRKGR